MKRIISLVLSVVLLIGVNVNNVSAMSSGEPNITNNISIQKEVSHKDVMALEPYVFVGEDGHFYLKEKDAINAGIDQKIIDGQLEYFDVLNKRINEGELIAKKDLSITKVENQSKFMIKSISTKSSHAYNCGGGLNTDAVATTYFGALPAAAGSGLASSYWWLLASRLDANNKGKGVHINMTWALVFDIMPQEG